MTKPTTTTASATKVDSPAASPAPNWAHVPFDVGCGRCGHDLRGLTESTCPACGLAFDWSKAVPIEQLTCPSCDYHLYGLQDTRCPECGEGFTWDAVLTTYHERRLPFFEYRWRDRPFRSLISTWFHALRPGKFWRSMDIHDPPRVGPLLMVPVLALCGFLLMLIAAEVMNQCIVIL